MHYECTLTLVPSWSKRRSARDQFILSKEELLEVLREHYRKDIKASFIAELHQSNDVHYHGVITLTDANDRDKFINRLRSRKIFGRRTITQLVNFPLWVKYLNKDINKTSQILGDPIAIDTLNILGTRIESQDMEPGLEYQDMEPS